MPTIHFIQPDGSAREVEAAEGTTVMQAAVMNGIEGIVGECGGSCMCATCHVVVDPASFDRLSPISAGEDEMLEFASSPRQETSRLGCQITMSDALDGIVLTVPG